MDPQVDEAHLLYPVYDGGKQDEPAQTNTPPAAQDPDNMSDENRQRVDFAKLTFGAMRKNPVYAIFIITIIYLVFRIGVTFLYPILRRPVFALFRLMYFAIGRPFDGIPIFDFICAVSTFVHWLCEDILYYYVLFPWVDMIFAVMVTILIIAFIHWLIWKYVMFFPLRDIVGAFLKVTPPWSWFWDFFDSMETFVFGTSGERFGKLAQMLVSGVGLIWGESLTRAGGKTGGTPTDPTTEARSSGEPDDAPTAALRLATTACTQEYNPYAFNDPVSQILVRTELTKCNLRALNAYYSVTQPVMGDLMTACELADGLPVVAAAEFVQTSGFVAAMTADGNTSRYDDHGMRVVLDTTGTTVATQVTDDGIMKVTDAEGRTGYLDAQRKRVVLDGSGAYVYLSDNLDRTLNSFAAQPSTADDPIRALMHRDDDLLACHFAALKTTPANVAVEMAGCDDDEATVDDPSLDSGDMSGSLANATTFTSASAARQRRVGTCQNAKATQLAKLS